jgi:phage protein D
VLRFVRPTDDRAGARVRLHEFTYGQTLRSFQPTLTLSRQVSEVTVRGWDNRNKTGIVATATSADLPGAGQGDSGPAAAERSLGGRSEVIVDAPVMTEQEARELAISLLRERAYEFITGNGEIIGLPDMRPGDNVLLEGLGERFSGSYYVRNVEHVINSSGYTTRFECRKVFEGSGE